jgi:hypothetical protein
MPISATAFLLKVCPGPTMFAPFSCEENGIHESFRGYNIKRNALASQRKRFELGRGW